MERVYSRSLELFRALHKSDDELFIVTNAYFSNIPKHKVKKLNLYRKYLRNKKILKQLHLEITPDIDAEPDEVPDPQNNTYSYWVKCKTNEINYSQLLKSICNHDVGIKPMIYHRVYFINMSRGTIFHIYDDRGCDLISSTKKAIGDIYLSFNEWILDYDREQIDDVFL
ncbi:hypothetical protein D3C81_1451580 [compost metagenome]